MKKLFFSAVALASLFFAASCQQENLEPVNASNTVTYTVQVPDVVATKALGDDVTPVNELVYEVYRTEGERVTTFTNVDNLLYHRTAPVNNGVATITLELVNDQNFTVLFWAQTKVLEDQTPIYNVDDLTNVTVSRNAVANNVNAAAFVGRDFIINCVSDSDCKVTLTRPVSQLNIATTQESLKKFNDVVVLEGSSVVVKGLSQDYNVATLTPGELNDNEYTYTETVVPTDVLKVGETDYVYVGMNYVGFAPQLGATLTVSYVINTTEGNIDNIIENVPVKPNYRTNIIGNLITSTTDYIVDLDPTWGGEPIAVEVINNVNELQAAINRAEPGETIVLNTDIDFSDVTTRSLRTYALYVPGNKTITLDLNGHVLSQTNEQAGEYSLIENNGNLTIIDRKGNGKISYKDSGIGGDYSANTISNHGALTIKSGLLENKTAAGVSCVINNGSESSNAVLYITGGCISNENGNAICVTANSATYSSDVNISGGEIMGTVDFRKGNENALGSLNITGGKFSVDPTANLPAGYAAEMNSAGVWVVFESGYMENGNEILISSAYGYKQLTGKASSYLSGKTVKLTADIDFDYENIKPVNFGWGENIATFDGQNHTLSRLMSYEYIPSWQNYNDNQALMNGKVNIKNLKVDGAYVYGRGYAGVIGGTVYGSVENCHVTNSSVESYFWQAGAIVGQYSGGYVKDCTVTGTTIKSYSSVGAIVGQMTDSTGARGARNFEDCVVRNCTIVMLRSLGPGYDEDFGLAVGYINVDNIQVNFTSCTFENNTIKGQTDNLPVYGGKEPNTTVTIQ